MHTSHAILCTKNPVTRAAVCSVRLPLETDSYKPVPNDIFLEMILGSMEQTGMVLHTERYGLTGGPNKDRKMFGVMTFGNDTEGSEHELAIGFRNSYDKSLAAGFATGANVFVCDNLCFSSNGFVVMRKHTTHVMDDLRRLVAEGALKALGNYQSIAGDVLQMTEHELTDDDAYALFGQALGHDVLTSTQVSSAVRDWKNPLHTEFTDKTLWSWYNCCNEALKGSRADVQLTQHFGLHSFALAQLPAFDVIDAEFEVATPELVLESQRLTA